MDPFMLFVIIALAFFVLFELMTSIKNHDVWRYVFLMPLLFIVGICAWVYIDINNNPKSHNLLPFELMIYLCYAIAAHVVLVITRYFINKGVSSND